MRKKKKALKIINIFRTKYLIFLILFIGIFNFLSTTVIPGDAFVVSASDIDIDELVSLTNTERNSRGLGRLTVDSRLVAAAQAKGEDMIAKDYWSHYGPNNESPWDFILEAGYNYNYAGENLAKDFSSASPIHSAWMASPSHRDNIINSNFENIGVAVVTGEFQGKETSIVVQMFGSLQGGYSEASSYYESSDSLPITGEGELGSPSIVDPKDGEILNDAAFDVRGLVPEGDAVKIYDDQVEIGTGDISDDEFVFANEDDYSDGAHSLYVKAFNNDGKASGYSNVVDITVDTIEPVIDIESMKFEYMEISSKGKIYTLSVKIEDNPVFVRGNYNSEESDFNYKEDKWEFQIEENKDFKELKINAADPAGNTDEVVISSEDLDELADNITLVDSEKEGLSKWFIDNIISRVFTRSIRGRVNFIVAFIMILLLTFEHIVLSRTGYTNERSSPLINLAVFAILLFTSLIGSGGTIL